MLLTRDDQEIIGELIPFQVGKNKRFLGYVRCNSAQTHIRKSNSGLAVFFADRDGSPKSFGEWLFSITDLKRDSNIDSSLGFVLGEHHTVADLRKGAPGELQFGIY